MRTFVLALSLLLSPQIFAKGLTIHAAEIGIGKFHRHDNGVHPYGNKNAWAPYVLSEGEFNTLPVVKEFSSDTITIFFDTLEGLLKEMVRISKAKNEKISVFNINAHGMPGGMWFPATEKIKKSFGCIQWLASAEGSDVGNYNQYYSAVSKEDILQMRKFSQTGGNVPCTVQSKEWRAAVKATPGFDEVFMDGARMNLLSCLVGLGPVGEKHTKELGEILFTKNTGTVRSSINLGLGDWSMEEGMGFWDYLSDEQIDHDNIVYPKNKEDREVMQKGSIRVASKSGTNWSTKIFTDLDFMTLDREGRDGGRIVPEPKYGKNVEKPSRIRIPGTTQYLKVD